jgi:ubiquinone/menaquinone biosynthesis C-methylase UbiE
MEVEVAALTVHAPIFNKELGRDGDFILRDNFHKNMLKIFENSGFKPTKILDIGCSTGLSTLKLYDSFPHCEIIGLDLSPYMLSGMLLIC